MPHTFRPLHPWKPGNCPASHLRDLAHRLGVQVRDIRHNSGDGGLWKVEIDFTDNAHARPWSHDPVVAVQRAEQAIIEYGRMAGEGT